MIGKLKGKISEIEGNIGLIETSGGVFYSTYLTSSITTRISKGDYIEVYTYLQVREDALILFGFESKKEFDLFKLLLTVPGVGPKTSYNIINFIKLDQFIQAIKENNTDYLTKIPGLGRKTALKIILELSQKLKTDFNFKNIYLSEDDKTVIDALVSLGFKPHEAKIKLTKISKDLSIENKIKEALKK